MSADRASDAFGFSSPCGVGTGGRGRWDLSQRSTNLHVCALPQGSPGAEPLRLQWLQLTHVCVPKGWAGRALVYCGVDGNRQRWAWERGEATHTWLTAGPEQRVLPARARNAVIKTLRAALPTL